MCENIWLHHIRLYMYVFLIFSVNTYYVQFITTEIYVTAVIELVITKVDVNSYGDILIELITRCGVMSSNTTSIMSSIKITTLLSTSIFVVTSHVITVT